MRGQSGPRSAGLMVAGFIVSGLMLASLSASGCGQNSSSPDGAAQQAPLRLNAGGSTFVYPLMSKWAAVAGQEHGFQINYQSIGSGGGIQKMIVGEFDFGCTDAPLNQEQLQKAQESGGAVHHVPLAMGAVAVVYHLDEVDEPLRLSGPLLADIFLRKVTRWNDPRILELNPQAAAQLPDKEIVVVHRSDGSGTTYIFADFLAKVSPQWKEEVGVSTSLKWADETIGAKGNEGIAGQVRLNPGAIGYVELTYALQSTIQFAAVQNQTGAFIVPELESVTAAAKNALNDIPDDLRYSLTNAPGPDSYPLSGTVWAVLYAKPGMNAETHNAVREFLRWAVQKDGGQKYCADLHYAPLPEELVERIETILASESR